MGKNRYYVIIERNGEPIRMIAKAHDVKIAESIALHELQKEDPNAKLTVKTCLRINR